MDYSELVFRGEYILAERERVSRDRMTAASFNAWQTVSPQMQDPLTWEKYLKNVGLSDEPKVTKEDLQREADAAMDKVNKIIESAGGPKNAR